MNGSRGACGGAPREPSCFTGTGCVPMNRADARSSIARSVVRAARRAIGTEREQEHSMTHEFTKGAAGTLLAAAMAIAGWSIGPAGGLAAAAPPQGEAKREDPAGKQNEKKQISCVNATRRFCDRKTKAKHGALLLRTGSCI